MPNPINISRTMIIRVKQTDRFPGDVTIGLGVSFEPVGIVGPFSFCVPKTKDARIKKPLLLRMSFKINICYIPRWT